MRLPRAAVPHGGAQSRRPGLAPHVFGAGNKLQHNVIGGIGVVVGNGGRLVHEPLRLSVLIEAPRAAITEILERHPQGRALSDDGRLHLLALDDEGRMDWRYAGDLGWEHCNSAPQGQDEASLVRA